MDDQRCTPEVALGTDVDRGRRLTLRPATAADSSMLYALHKATMRQYAEAIYGPWDDEAQLARHDDWLRRSHPQIIQCGDQPVGVIEWVERDHDLYLGRIEVRPDLQRSGIGTRALRHLAAIPWEGAPEGARSIALTCYDPDAPTGSGFFHWFVVGIGPGHTEIDRGGHIDGSAVLRNDFGNTRYDGAAPPLDDGPHRYIFAVHALGATADDLALPTAPSLASAGLTMTQHAIGRGTLTVTYEQP